MNPFRGGKIRRRDRWYGLEDEPDFDQFRDWWHREGKEAHGGNDLGSRSEATRRYNDWKEWGRPRGK
jgi:hypothetical protein